MSKWSVLTTQAATDRSKWFLSGVADPAYLETERHMASDLHKASTVREPAPEWLSINDAKRIYRLSHTGLYRMIGGGAVEGRKLGRRTLLSRRSLDDYFETLPRFSTKAAA